MTRSRSLAEEVHFAEALVCGGFLGSLALLVGFIGLYLAANPHTFDIPELAAAAPLAAHPVAGGLVLAAILLGLAVKTPTVPFHTWLPPAHTDASEPVLIQSRQSRKAARRSRVLLVAGRRSWPRRWRSTNFVTGQVRLGAEVT